MILFYLLILLQKNIIIFAWLCWTVNPSRVCLLFSISSSLNAKSSFIAAKSTLRTKYKNCFILISLSLSNLHFLSLSLFPSLSLSLFLFFYFLTTRLRTHFIVPVGQSLSWNAAEMSTHFLCDLFDLGLKFRTTFHFLKKYGSKLVFSIKQKIKMFWARTK